MRAPSAQAKVTLTAGTVDLPHNIPASKKMVRCNHPPDKFMPQDSPETHITFDDLQISIADCGIENFNQYFACSGFRDRDLPKGKFIFEKQGLHELYLIWITKIS
jgi:hypothetical protein